MDNNPEQQTQPVATGFSTDGSVNKNENIVNNANPRFDVNNIYPNAKPVTEVGGSIYPTKSAIESKPDLIDDEVRGADSSNILVLQWVNYTLWLWIATLTSILASGVIGFFLKSNSLIDNLLTYGIAAMIVLLPIFIISDRAYLKREQSRKTGASLAIMTIHAVIFIVSCLASLVAAASSIAGMIVDGSNVSLQWSSLISSIIVAIFFALAGLRTLSLGFLPKIKQLASIIMSVVVIIIVTFGVFGPMAKTALLKNDKLIENNLSDVSDGIKSYISKNNKMPASLENLNLTGDAQKLVTSGAVTYKNDNVVKSDYGSVYKYQLCVKYAQEYSGGLKNYSSSSLLSEDDYSSYLSTYGHESGDVCYKLRYSNYSYEDL